MKRFLGLIAVLWLAVPWLQGYTSPDDEYIRIYNLIQQADALAQNAQPAAAYQQYQAAQDALKQLQTGSPGWNEKVIEFRLRYVAAKMAEAAAKLPPGTLPNVASPKVAAPKPASAEELQNQVQTLSAELQRVEADRKLLAAKLREALSAQPAAADPRELAKAEEKVRALQKDNELLKAGLEAQKAKVGQWIDPAVHAVTEKALAEANRKLADQAQVLATLAAQNARPSERAMAAAERQRFEALRAENEILKKRLTERDRGTIAPPPAKGSADALRVAKAEAALQRDEAASLRREKAALEKQLADARKQSEANAASLAAMQKKLAAASRKSERRRSPPAAAEERLTSEEIGVLRARLAVLEAAKVPYTTEEAALFKAAVQPVAAVALAAGPAAQPESKPSPPAAHVTPPDAVTLLAEAKRLSDAGRYAEAEKSYQQALRVDENNSSTLANLASVQLELGRLSDAEANLKRALAAGPNDPFNLYLLGALRFHQNRFDEALDSLSRAVKLEPDKAVMQNLLGVVLIQKGLRDQAETAFRKAVQIYPEYAEAHLNLARVYALHQPPLRALARFHYQKALDAGAAKDSGLEKFFAEPSP